MCETCETCAGYNIEVMIYTIGYASYTIVVMIYTIEVMSHTIGYVVYTIVVMICTTEVMWEAYASYNIEVMSHTIGYLGSDRREEIRRQNSGY